MKLVCSRIDIFGLTRVLLTLTVAAVFLTQISCRKDSYWVQLSGATTIGNEWIDFTPKALKTEKDRQYIVLELASPFEEYMSDNEIASHKGNGILMPDGAVINREIQIIDQFGNIFSLGWSGSHGYRPMHGLPYPNELPRDREYRTVRIRSSRPIKLKALYWFCESDKDRK